LEESIAKGRRGVNLSVSLGEDGLIGYNNDVLKKGSSMQNKPLLSGLLWRIAIWLAFAILLIAIGYVFAMLVTALNSGMQM
jgi:hypothetical protein